MCLVVFYNIYLSRPHIAGIIYCIIGLMIGYIDVVIIGSIFRKIIETYKYILIIWCALVPNLENLNLY